ncbi:hypothetical protein AQJ46_11920 [Streptomyces canus]|uniref:Uncharacterized protein n=1 Tax=Streptomyces canus TaxID=58343 RepID=A0A117R5Q3_9ACTN|nr:hypothetical protein AQJ46_11920 [Streptomyces canus]
MGMLYVSWSLEVGPVAQYGSVTTVTWGSAVRSSDVQLCSEPAEVASATPTFRRSGQNRETGR